MYYIRDIGLGFLFFYLFIFSCYGSTLQIIKGNVVNIYNSSSFFSYSDIDISEINNCDPDINIEYNECYVYLKYYFPIDYFVNLSLISGSFFTYIDHNISENRYDEVENAYKIYIIFPVPQGASSCEDFLNQDLFFNISTDIFSKHPSLGDTSVPWTLRVYVWRCSGDNESCGAFNGYWHVCQEVTNYSSIIVPKNRINYIKAYGEGVNTVDGVVYVYKDSDFDLEVEIENVRDDYHNGASIDSFLYIASSLPDNINPLSSTTLFLGNVSSGEIRKYNFSFYADTISPSSIPITINYTDKSGFYSTNKTSFIKITNLFITDFSITSDNVVPYGGSIDVRVEVKGNATPIDFVKIVARNILTGKKYEFLTTTPERCTDVTSCIYSIRLKNLPSGRYNLTAYVSDYDRIALSTTPNNKYDNISHILIRYGEPRGYLKIPGYYLLDNQTLRYNFSVYAFNGDLSNLTIIINGSSNLNYTNNVFYISHMENNHTIHLTGILRVKDLKEKDEPAFTEIIISYYNGTSFNTTKIERFDHLIIPLRIYTDKKRYDFSENSLIEIRIAGNYTPIAPITINITSLLDNNTEQFMLLNPTKISNTLYCFNQTDKYEKDLIEDSIIRTNNLYDPNATRDNDNSTSWVGTSGDYINYSFSTEMSIDSIDLLVQTPDKGTLTIIADNKYNITSIDIPSFPTSIKVKLNYKYSNISLFVETGVVTIYEVKVYPTIQNETCYIYSLNYIPRRSGMYKILGFNANTTGNTSFFVDYGEVNVSSVISTLISRTKNNISIEVKAINGDVVNKTISLTIINKSIAYSLDNLTKKNISILYNGQTVVLSWSVFINTTFNGNLYFNLSYDNISTVVSYPVVISDLIPPYILGFSFPDNITNVNLDYNFVVFINETIRLKNYTLVLITPYGEVNITKELIYPIFGENVSLNVSIPGTYLNVSNETYLLKEIYISDYNHTIKEKIDKSITTIDSLTLVYDKHYDVFNHGQTINISVLDIANREVINAMWNITLQDIQGTYNETIFEGINNKNYFIYQVPSYLNNTPYQLIINVSYKSNYGNLTIRFNVTNQLKETIIAPPEPYTVTTGKGFYLSLFFSYLNGEKYNTSSIIIPDETYIYCFNESYSQFRNRLFSTYDYPNYENVMVLVSQQLCYAPTSKTSFTIELHLRDIYNNEIHKNLTFYAVDIEKIQQVTSSASTTQKVVSTTSGGGSREKIIYINNTQNTTIRYIYVNESELEIFNANLTTSYMEIQAGDIKENSISLSNKIDKEYAVHIYWNSSINLNISLPEQIIIKPHEEKNMLFSVYVPSYVSPGEYKVYLLMTSQDVRIEKIMFLNVLPNPTIENLKILNRSLYKFKKELDDLRQSGIDTRNMEEELQEFESLLKKSEEYLYKDNLSAIMSIYPSLEKMKTRIDKEMRIKKALLYIKQNKGQLFAIGVALISGVSLFLFYILPLIHVLIKEKRITNEINKIKATLRNLDLQYFKRKIDEYTYRNTVIKENEKMNALKVELLRVRAQKNYLLNFNLPKYFKTKFERKKEREVIERMRLTPEEINRIRSYVIR